MEGGGEAVGSGGGALSKEERRLRAVGCQEKG